MYEKQREKLTEWSNKVFAAELLTNKMMSSGEHQGSAFQIVPRFLTNWG